MTCFRIDLEEADRAGVHPVMFEGRFIGVSHDPFASAAQWLTRYKDAQPNDTIDLRAGGVQLQYGRISNAEWLGRRADKDDNPNDDEIVDETTDPDEHEPSMKKQKKSKKVPITDDENEEPALPDEDKPEGRAYWNQVRATVRNILQAHAVATGRTPTPLSKADAVYETTVGVYAAEVATTGRFTPSAEMIIAADKKRRGEI